MTKGYLHSIETFGTVDGPGTRYVVFLQGCPLRCLYCHNPDTWDFKGGQEITVKELLQGYEHKKAFYKDGGITCTGGEALMQMDFVTELFCQAKQKNIHTALDTSGYGFKRDEKTLEKFDKLLKCTDLVLLDLKHIDFDEHKKLTGVANTNILDFARYLDEKNIPVWIRHVIVYNYTYNREYLQRLGQFLATLNNIKALDILPYHGMGVSKYEQIGKTYPLKDAKEVSKEDAIKAKNTILKALKEAKIAMKTQKN